MCRCGCAARSRWPGPRTSWSWWTAITFDAALTLDVAAVTLWIRNGYLVAVGGGECKARLGLSYDGHPLIDEIELKTLKLPGKAMFRAPGIALPGREESLIIEPVPPTAGG